MELNIAYSCNDAYVPHTGISIISLLENNKSFENINIYFIEKDVKQDSINLLESVVKCYNRNFIVVPFNEIASKLKVNTLGRHIETVYAKLFFVNLIGIDKILYLDSVQI